MAEVQKLQRVISALRKKVTEAKESNVSVTVGYTQEYAIYVHENLEAHHPVGQAKFLEQPAREYARDIADIIKTAMQRTKDMAQSLLLGGLFLQRKSQEQCPVDTGALRASAFTRIEE